MGSKEARSQPELPANAVSRLFAIRGLKKVTRAVLGPRSPHAALIELRRLADARDWRELETQGRKFVERHSSNGEAIALVAYSLQQQGRLEEAADHAKKAAQIAPTLFLAQFIAGISLAALNRNLEAISFLRAALAISPADLHSVRLLTNALAQDEGIEAARAEYVRLAAAAGITTEVVIATVSSVPNWAERSGVAILRAGEIEQVPFTAPKVWGEDTDPEVVFAASNAPYVVEIPDARIFGQSSIVLTADGFALNDSAGHPEFGRFVSFEYENVVVSQLPEEVILDFGEYATRSVDRAILLSGLASDAFGHWLPEFLPKLQFLQHHPLFSSTPIVVDEGMPQSHFDHLARLVTNELIRLGPRESLLCGTLLVAPSPTFFPVELLANDIPVEKMAGLSPRAMRYLRGTERPARHGVEGTRIFLGRRNMRWRRLLNEEELETDLESLGFRTVFVGDLSAREQIDLFSRAEWIVAPNGSALLNVIFAETTVRLVVLTQPNLFNWGTFQGPMDALGYESICVRGEYAIAETQKHSDYRISTTKVREALASLGLTDALTSTEGVLEP
jgi:Glycosyltransferase 61